MTEEKVKRVLVLIIILSSKYQTNTTLKQIDFNTYFTLLINNNRKLYQYLFFIS